MSSSMSLDEPSAINDFSRVFIISLEPQISWAADTLSSVTVWRHWATRDKKKHHLDQQLKIWTNHNQQQNWLRHLSFANLKFFPPLFPPCDVVTTVRASCRKHSNFQWRGERRGVFCSPKLPHLRTMSQQFCPWLQLKHAWSFSSDLPYIT